MTDDKLVHLVRSVDPVPGDTGPDTGEALLARVLATPGPRRRRRLGRLLRPRNITTIALGFAVVLVPPAVAFHNRLLDLIQGRPAPPPVTRAFQAWNWSSVEISLPDLAGLPYVDAGNARGVAELHTHTGSISLWVAPNDRGADCWVYVYRGATPTAGAPEATSLHCDLQSEFHSAGPLGIPQMVLNCVMPSVWFVHVQVRGVTGVQLVYPDGHRTPMRVVNGTAVAAFRVTDLPTAIAAVDDVGSTLATEPANVSAPLDFFGRPNPCSSPNPSMSFGGGGVEGNIDSGDDVPPSQTPTDPHFDLRGTLNKVTPTSITVGKRPDQIAYIKATLSAHGEEIPSGLESTCNLTPDSPSLDGFHTGETVEINCSRGNLTSIVDAKIWARGTITALSRDSIGIDWSQVPTGAPPFLVCSRTPSSPPVGFKVGEPAFIECEGGRLLSIQAAGDQGGGSGWITPEVSLPSTRHP